MKSRGMSWLFWAAIFGALLLFALAASTPAWAARVPGARLTSVDPPVVVGLVSVLLAILTLVGGAVFYLLRLVVDDAERSVAERVEREVATPLTIAMITLSSFDFYLDYSNRWRENQYTRDMETDYGFRWSVFQAVHSARGAHKKAHLLSDGEKHKGLHLETTSSLAYHLATRYLLERDERDKEEAFTLLKELELSSSRDWEFQEAITWVKILCNQRGTEGYEEGLTAIRRLMGHKDIPLQWRLAQHEKYKNLFQVDLPAPT